MKLDTREGHLCSAPSARAWQPASSTPSSPHRALSGSLQRMELGEPGWAA